MASILFNGGVALNQEFGAAGSGLGFFGAGGFGASVQVGAYQGRTFVCNGAGTQQGPECNNITYLSANSGILGQAGTGIPLQSIPNGQASLNIRFTNAGSNAVKTQNAKLIIYDRAGSPPEQFTASGVTTQVAQINHISQIQGPGGSGFATWSTFLAGVTGLIVLPTCSPGSGATYVSGTNTTDINHDWYFAISASPNSIGSKTQFGLYWSNEYL